MGNQEVDIASDVIEHDSELPKVVHIRGESARNAGRLGIQIAQTVHYDLC
jgi:hypothetical protein